MTNSTAPYTRRPLFLRGSAAPASYWRGSRSAESAGSQDAILTEDSIPILTEDGAYLLIES